MAKRRSSRSSLYELIKTRPGRAPAQQIDAADDRLREAAPGPRWLSRGRTMTLPVGYVLLGGALAIAGIAGAYMFGYNRAHRLERERFEQALIAQAAALDDGERPRDPLLDLERPGGGTLPGPGTGVPRAEPVRDERGWGPIASDPRQPDHKYFVLMTTTEAGAVRLATFCRERGLETYAVRRKNKLDSFLVIALPGFPAETSNQAPEYRELGSRIEDIGLQWKRDGGGSSDLHDAYPLVYTPDS